MPSKHIHRVRAEAGRKGAAARWGGAEREQTVKIRVYASDAMRLKEMPGTSAQAVRALLTAAHPLKNDIIPSV